MKFIRLLARLIWFLIYLGCVYVFIFGERIPDIEWAFRIRLAAIFIAMFSAFMLILTGEE